MSYCVSIQKARLQNWDSFITSRLEQIRKLSPIHLQLIYHLQDRDATQGMVNKHHYYWDEGAQDMGLKNTRLYW